MKLIDLSPQWIVRDGVNVGLTFKCPCCFNQNTPSTDLAENTKHDRNRYLSCGFVHMTIHEQFDLFLDPMSDRGIVCTPFNQAGNWKPNQVIDFNTLSISPSIDASNSGHWHGFITNGEIVG
jgi:hypothetical protein